MNEIIEKIKKLIKPKLIIIFTMIIFSNLIMAGAGEKVGEVVTFWGANKVAILAFLLALSELLSISPKIKANGIFQMLVNLLKKWKS